MGQTLFEVSWEIGNKIGGIHTVVSTKARTMVAAKGDNYVCLGPWLMFDEQGGQPFDDEPGFEPLIDSCRELGVPVRVGRWRIPGRPRTILVEFSGLYERKDQVLAQLWERYHVDSLFGGWEYIEPLMFGHACGIVIEQYWQEFVAPYHHDAIAQFHEWLTAAGALYLKHHRPSIGTVFTAHATALGRALSATGQSPRQGLAGQSPEELAEAFGIRSKHSLEGVAARECDVFTTVSEITGQEAELFHYRKAAPILPNGIDLGVLDEMAGSTSRAEARRIVLDLASRFHGEDLSDAAIVTISGRYEFHNKGIDVFLDAMSELEESGTRKVLGLILVPAGNSGLRQEVGKRQHMELAEISGSLGVSTHNLFEGNNDPILSYCKRVGLAEGKSAKVKILHVPVNLTGRDGVLNIPHEAVLRASDVTCFPSFYEPWGYTPQESLGLGVPTITSDFAGFGRFCVSEEIGHDQGVDVLLRTELPYEEIGTEVARLLLQRLDELAKSGDMVGICRETAKRTAWSDLVANYHEAWDRAIEVSSTRKDDEMRPMLRQRPLPVRPRRDAKRPRLFQFDVAARVPEELEGLVRLAENYWWSWDAEAMHLFEEVSPQRWEICRHNPIQFLQEVYPSDLEEKANDAEFVGRLEGVLRRRNAYLAEKPSFAVADGQPTERNPMNPVAYFCAEFGIHESLKIYSGGLGLLAGDHLKSASDLNIPLVAVGLFYSKGYMQQKLTVHGDQISLDQENDPRRLPMKLVRDESEEPVLIEIDLPGSKVQLRAWRVDVGRVPLYLLDADIEQNRPEDREITAHLYGGTSENRLRQEIVLGRGGVRLLQRIGVQPSVYHMNEGHAAFLALERVATLLRDEGLTFEEAHEFVRRTTVFTTHTPVPAGHDRFGEELIRRYFGGVSTSAGIPWDRFYELGLADEDNASFNMSYFALNFSSVVNGVSKLHGEVSKSLFMPFWPELLESEIPVRHVTNGVHLPTWTMPELGALYGVQARPIQGEDFAGGSEQLEAERLWELKQKAKKRLLSAIKSRMEESFVERNDSPIILQEMLHGLDHRALIIGFARRFAPYKRAHLLFQDTERLAEILNHPNRPIRIFFAGKAHPRDGHGQEILKRVVEMSRREPFIGKIFFLEGYDIELARYLVQGVDVWLNTPTRPLEASGTSGMKVAANGGLNLSILDGWWCEGHESGDLNGWAIGKGRLFQSQELQDEMDGATLYQLLEESVLPLYHERDTNGIPHGWVQKMKRSLGTVPVFFNTNRMLEDYESMAYRPLSQNWFRLSGGRYTPVRRHSERLATLRDGFESLAIREARVADLSSLKVGDDVVVKVEVLLGNLAPEQVQVELILVPSTGAGIEKAHIVQLHDAGTGTEGGHVFEGSHRMQRSGGFSYGIRVRAREESPFDLSIKDLVVWA